MARSTDNLKAYRAMMGMPVEVSLIEEGRTVRGIVWSPAPLDALTTTAKYLRARFGMEKAAERDSLFVMIEGGRVAHAEVNVSTHKGYGVTLRPALRGGTRHDVTDAEIAEIHAAYVEGAEPMLLSA